MIRIVIVILITSIRCVSQTTNPDILQKKWEAYWIAPDNTTGHNYGVYHFRKTFDLQTTPSAFIIHVSADNRYKLFVNGTLVTVGPARGDLYHWYFETIDISKYLRAGKNVVASIVWNIGNEKPEAQISYRTAFIVQGNGEAEKILNTNKSWKTLQNKSFSTLKPELIYTYYVAGPGDKVTPSQYPWNWQQLEYEDNQWATSYEIMNGLPKGVFDWSSGWMLMQRTIPLIELSPQRLKKIRLIEGKLGLVKKFPAEKESLHIPANTKIRVLLDQSHLTTAYPTIEFSKGKDASISMSYAEALYINEGSEKDWRAQNKKGNRDSIDKKRFVGVLDNIISDGTNRQYFSPLWWRTYRYLQLELETKNEALEISDLYSLYTAYPFQLNASFTSNNDTLQKIFDVGWRTARLCAQETYVDCPYYEQLQYIGDTRIQAMISYFNSGDDRLAKQAILSMDYSRLSEGITMSRYPTDNAQIIPPFSLFWIGMIHDFWRYRSDTLFVKNVLPGMRQVLHFFSKFQKPDGSLYQVPYWNFSDWSEGTGWYRGVAPVGKNGSSSVMDFQLLWAYQLAAELEANLGMKALANEYSSNATQLQQTIKNKYFLKDKFLYADTEEKDIFSQHANTLAILTGTVINAEATKLAQQILANKTLTPATIYFKYYINQALVKAGLGELYLDQLDIWKQNLSMGMTTWAEISDINAARSDCHAWGSSPNIEFFRIVLGLDSDSPGFKKINIRPHLGSLKKASGKMPHPQGEVEMSYTLLGNSWQAKIVLPKNTNGTLSWKGLKYQLKTGNNEIRLPVNP